MMAKARISPSLLGQPVRAGCLTPTGPLGLHGPARHTSRPQPSSLFGCPPAVPLRTALLGRTERVPLTEAIGRACGCIQTVCPPGVPLVMPGEILDQQTVNLLLQAGFDSIHVLK